MLKALIIGCGNIGAMYDFDNQSVLTYAKAFHLDSEIEFEVFDVNTDLSNKVAQRYGVRSLSRLSHTEYTGYDIITICTPTSTHHEYLLPMLTNGPRLVICEKPIDTDITRLNEAKLLYQKSRTKVMVNFYRRFLPGMAQLKSEIKNILVREKCTNIIVTYQRGFHNNASHSVDLLEFLFESALSFSESKIIHQEYDEFETDSTISLSCVWNAVHVQFVGLVWAEFSHFELAIYFTKTAIFVKDGGNTIEWFSSPQMNGKFYPKLYFEKRLTSVTENYMVNVINYAKRVLKEHELPCNFLESVNISLRILQLQGY